MIPREILKMIRQIQIRPHRIVSETLSDQHIRLRIPKGFRPQAQRCAERATLDQRPQKLFNRNAVATIPVVASVGEVCHHPVEVDRNVISFTQVGSGVASLGYMPEPHWDSQMAAESVHPDPIFALPPSLIAPA